MSASQTSRMCCAVWWTTICSTGGVDLVPSHHIDNFAMGISLVASTRGIALVPAYVEPCLFGRARLSRFRRVQSAICDNVRPLPQRESLS